MKNTEYWDSLLEESPNQYKELINDEKAFLIKNIKKDSKVLEVGCGTGRSLKDLFLITKDVCGIDHDKKAIENAKVNLKEQGLSIILAEGDFITFENETFDFTLCLMTFSNLAGHRNRVLKEMKRVTKKNGKLLISCYNEDSIAVRIEMYRKLKIPIKNIINGTVIFDESIGDNISEQFNDEELRNIFQKAKLKIESIEKKGIGNFCVLSV
jgi:ubiquinone/menaquinone biosynthesis C-methylase UbiE